MKQNESIVSDLACWVTAGVFLFGLAVLAVKLREVQIEESAAYNYRNERQSVRRIQTAGLRGRILDRNGITIAGNRRSVSIICNAEQYQRKTWKETEDEIAAAIADLGRVIGREDLPSSEAIAKYVYRSRTMPLTVWSDVNHETIARLSEHNRDFPGFECLETEERVYPGASLAAHLIGYVGRDHGNDAAGDAKFNFRYPELRGRSGLEIFYDGFLRGVPGEKRIRVDARCFAIEEWTVKEPSRGPDLELTIDVHLQQTVESQLRGHKGACVVLDPRNGEILAMASAPAFDLNAFIPHLKSELYRRYADDPQKPLLNRASGGAYAPGSTFKPITSLAGLSVGFPADATYECQGAYRLGEMTLHCARRWGHGPLDMRHALKESCNPYFCNLGMDIGTNALVRTAKAFGLGAKTGVDLGVDMAGAIPDAEWKDRMYHEKWYNGDLAQMSIGQGMLLVSPLQMARVAGAIGTGYLVTPHLKKGLAPVLTKLPFPRADLDVVREGMRMVVDGGTGRRGGEGVPVAVSGKTGTAEIGKGATRRKNTWFIAYAPSEAPRVAVALVIENGESGGGTSAPKVANILKEYFETL